MRQCNFCLKSFIGRKGKLNKFCSQRCHYSSRSQTWSSKHAQCVGCGSSKRKHEGYGLCRLCYSRDNKQIIATRSRSYRLRRRMKILEHYGKNCQCCGEDTFEFLSIDHVNGDGGKHRKEVGSHMDLWIIKNNFPQGFQVLCHNCNMAKGFYGKCPHEQEVKLTHPIGSMPKGDGSYFL